MRVNAASLDIRDATTSTPGTLNDLTTDLIMANNNNVQIGIKSREYFGLKKWPLGEGRKEISQYIWFKLPANINY